MRLPIDWVEVPDACPECSKEPIRIGYCGGTASIVPDYIYSHIDGWRGYDYVMIDGKKYRLYLEEVKNE